MSALEKLLDEVADIIADKVAARLGGTAPAKKGVPAEADPPDVTDKDDGAPAEEAAEEKPARRTRKSRKAESKKEPEPEQEDDTDLPTPEQLALVREDCEDYDIDTAKSELLDYYVSQGHKKADAAAQIAECSNDEIMEAFLDYSARLLALQDDGGYDFTDDFDSHYKAERVVDGDTVVVWVKFASTLTPEEVEEAGLDDPNASGEEEEEEEEEKPKPKKKRTRKAKA